MFKNQLIELLNLNIINTKEKSEVELLLQLDQEEVNILLNNKNDVNKVKLLFELLNLNIINTKENSGIEFLSQLDQEELNILLNNKDDVHKVKLLCTLIINFKDSVHYKFLIEKVKTIKNYFLLEDFFSLVNDEDLLESEHYEFAVTKVLEIKDTELFHQFVDIAINNVVLTSTRYEFILITAMKIKDSDLLRNFRSLLTPELLESSLCDFILTKASEITDINVFKCFKTIAMHKLMLKDSNYKERIEQILRLNTISIGLIDMLLKNNSCGNALKNQLIEHVIEIKDEEILNSLLKLFETSKKLNNNGEVIIMFDYIEKILKLNSVDVILEMLNELLTINTDTYENSLCTPIKETMDKSIKERQIVNVIMSSTNEDIEKSLSVLPDDEDITPNTFVKKIMPPRM